MMEVQEDYFILNGSRFAAMLSAAKVNFSYNVFLCPNFLLEKNTKKFDFTTQ